MTGLTLTVNLEGLLLVDEIQHILGQPGLGGVDHSIVIRQPDDGDGIDHQEQAADCKPTQYHCKPPMVSSTRLPGVLLLASC